MRKILVLVDFQNDFIDGSLGTAETVAIVPQVLEKLAQYAPEDRLATLDTHFENYLSTQEGQNLPVMHCQKGSFGWQMRAEAQLGFAKIFEKNTFGSLELPQHIKALAENEPDGLSVELIGICTDICVVSNALLIKAHAPEIPLLVDSRCCAATTPERQLAALETLKSCQVQVL